MDNFTFYSPTYFVFGKETEKETGKYVKKYGGTKVLIHYGGGSAVRSGLIARIEASLDAEGIGYVELGGVKASPHADLIYKGIDFAKKEKSGLHSCCWRRLRHGLGKRDCFGRPL